MIFDSLIQPPSNENLVWTKCDCTEATWQDDQKIAMIHLDAPKRLRRPKTNSPSILGASGKIL